jgi:hypothetical protein
MIGKELQELQEFSSYRRRSPWLGGKIDSLNRKLMGRNRKQELFGDNHAVTPELLQLLNSFPWLLNS